MVSVDDDCPRIIETLRRLAATHDVIVSTGGLGPTTDDLTALCAARAAQVSLVRDPASVEEIRDRFRIFRRRMGPSNIKQADIPSGAVVMTNAVGTAPGFWMCLGRAKVFFFPGVPREMVHLWEKHAQAVIGSYAKEPTAQIRLHTFGEGESAVAERLADVETLFSGVIVGYRASFPVIEVKLLARGAGAQALVEAAADFVRGRLGSLIYGQGEQSFVSVVAQAVRNSGLRLALAESCTGGLMAQLLTSEPASDYLAGGLVTYANDAKVKLLGVPESLLEEHGAVSEPVAKAMAIGAARAMGAALAVATTGIAGPTGGTEDKPVGLVYYAVAYPGGVQVRHQVFFGDRSRVQRIAAFSALQLLRTCIASPTGC